MLQRAVASYHREAAISLKTSSRLYRQLPRHTLGRGLLTATKPHLTTSTTLPLLTPHPPNLNRSKRNQFKLFSKVSMLSQIHLSPSVDYIFTKSWSIIWRWKSKCHTGIQIETTPPPNGENPAFKFANKTSMNLDGSGYALTLLLVGEQNFLYPKMCQDLKQVHLSAKVKSIVFRISIEHTRKPKPNFSKTFLITKIPPLRSDCDSRHGLWIGSDRQRTKSPQQKVTGEGGLKQSSLSN